MKSLLVLVILVICAQSTSMDRILDLLEGLETNLAGEDFCTKALTYENLPWCVDGVRTTKKNTGVPCYKPTPKAKCEYQRRIGGYFYKTRCLKECKVLLTPVCSDAVKLEWSLKFGVIAKANGNWDNACSEFGTPDEVCTCLTMPELKDFDWSKQNCVNKDISLNMYEEHAKCKTHCKDDHDSCGENKSKCEVTGWKEYMSGSCKKTCGYCHSTGLETNLAGKLKIPKGFGGLFSSGKCTARNDCIYGCVCTNADFNAGVCKGPVTTRYTCMSKKCKKSMCDGEEEEEEEEDF